ncbi:MAG: quinone-dependent dihydroorotate dehydrogenase, partial [Dongiaceae bacterium]
MMRLARLLPPETAHALALRGLGLLGPGAAAPASPQSLRTTLWGRRLANPIGLAAGLDKDGVAIAGF